MLVDCYYRSRSSNVVWGYLRPQTTAAALAVPHPSPFSLLLLLPRLSRRCSCSFHIARRRRFSGRRCHCCIRIQLRSSPHCCRRPSPLPPRRRCSQSFSGRVPRRDAPRRPPPPVIVIIGYGYGYGYDGYDGYDGYYDGSMVWVCVWLWVWVWLWLWLWLRHFLSSETCSKCD